MKQEQWSKWMMALTTMIEIMYNDDDDDDHLISSAIWHALAEFQKVLTHLKEIVFIQTCDVFIFKDSFFWQNSFPPHKTLIKILIWLTECLEQTCLRPYLGGHIWSELNENSEWFIIVHLDLKIISMYMK